MNGYAEKDAYVIGDLLWAKIGNHPFWPCMVSYDPIEGCYSKIKKARQGEIKIYHVQYFGKQVQHGWTIPGLIFPFEGEEKFYEFRTTLLKNASQESVKKKLIMKYSVVPAVKKAWLIAVREAEVALSVDVQERFETFVFKYETKKTTSTNDNSLKRHGKNKDDLDKPSKKAKKDHIARQLCRLCEKGNVNLSCAGNCVQFYHKECLGIVCAPKDYKCLDCEKGLLFCFVCKKAGVTPIKCKKCNYHYHDECLKKFKCANNATKICSRHVCLSCHNEKRRNATPKGSFVQCFRCPTAFHTGIECVPAGSVQLTPSLIICPDHFLAKNKVSPQPAINVSYCTICSDGGELICCEACPNAYHVGCINREVPAGDFFCDDCLNRKYLYVGMIVWAKTGVYRWWPAQVISAEELPLHLKNMESYDGEFPIQFFGTDEYFWTHRGRVIPYVEHHKDYISISKPGKLTSQYKISLEEAAEAYDEYISERLKKIPDGKPDPYKHIKVNRAIPPVQTPILNKESLLPCNCDPNSPHPCSQQSSCLNREVQLECYPDMCRAKDCCENQKFQRRQYMSVKLKKTVDRGWGLIANEFIPKGSFVIEYVGEIITHEEYRKRANQMREKNIQNYYFLYLDSRRMIDAGPRGNLSRFINHSCNPNCMMQKWSVNSDSRIGIFAITDIEPGDELTFNYQSDSIQFEQKCLCGASNCQGFIGRNGEKQNGKKKQDGIMC